MIYEFSAGQLFLFYLGCAAQDLKATGNLGMDCLASRAMQFEFPLFLH